MAEHEYRSLAIEVREVESVLLGDGWHEIEPVSFDVGWYEFIDSPAAPHDEIVMGQGDAEHVSNLGFSFRENGKPWSPAH